MNSRFEEILEILRARGSLEKDDILSTWELSEDEYAALRNDFLKISDVEAGPQKQQKQGQTTLFALGNK